MLQVEQAIDQILSQIVPLGSEKVSLEKAPGRILRRDIQAPHHLPAFDNSAMDGYAVRSIDLSTASASQPVDLRQGGLIAAGEKNSPALQAGQCIRIFTGSQLPPGADAVIMQEDTETISQESIRCLDRVRPWENVRFQG